MTKGFADELVEKVARALLNVTGNRGRVSVQTASRWVPEVLAALDQNDRLALLRQSLPEGEVAVVLTKDEFVVSLLGTDDGKPAVPPSLNEAREALRAKLQALLSNSEQP